MNNYLFTIEEILSKSVSIKAETEEEAFIKLKELYYNDKIELDYSNYIESNINFVMIDNENNADYEVDKNE